MEVLPYLIIGGALIGAAYVVIGYVTYCGFKRLRKHLRNKKQKISDAA